MDIRIPKQKTGYHLEELDGEMLLYHPAETKTIYLNGTGALIWNLCDGERTVAAIGGLLKENYPDAAYRIDEELVTTLDQFATHGAIEYR